MAAFEVTTGEVIATDIAKNNSVTFADFLADIDAKVAPGLAIHVVLDNGSSHISKFTKAWLAEHPRFVAHYTAVHASWVNQVELFFSIITRKVLKRGSFTLVPTWCRNSCATSLSLASVMGPPFRQCDGTTSGSSASAASRWCPPPVGVKHDAGSGVVRGRRQG
jgi:transposase